VIVGGWLKTYRRVRVRLADGAVLKHCAGIGVT
jgi:hypothetical protein